MKLNKKKVEAIKNYWGVADGKDPIAQVNNNTEFVQYAPWCTANNDDCAAQNYDITSNAGPNKYYGAAQYSFALSEAAAGEIITFDNHTSAMTQVPVGTEIITINGSDNTTFNQGQYFQERTCHSTDDYTFVCHIIHLYNILYIYTLTSWRYWRPRALAISP